MLAKLIEASAMDGTDTLVNPARSADLRECDKVLCKACQDGDLDLAREALGNGANPTVRFALTLGEITPIFMCATNGTPEIAQLLVNANKKVISDVKGFDGATCLHYAASQSRAEMCDFLIANGCEVNKQDKLGRTPLMDAAEVGCLEVIKVLIEHEADIGLVDNNHHSAVAYCLDFVAPDDHKFYNASMCLIQKGADPSNYGKFTHRTLLHHVAARGDLEYVRKLVEDDKVKANPIDDKGRTPLDYAIEHEKADVIDYLEKAIPKGRQCDCVLL